MKLNRWVDALEHARLLARMIILEGNISDMYIQESGLEAGRLVELDEFLYEYLKAAGYHSVVFFNRIDSFYNHCDTSGEMLDLFFKEAGCREKESKLPLSEAMGAIRTAMSNDRHSLAIVIDMAGQLMGNPEHLGDNEIEYLTTLFLAAKEAAEAPIASCEGWKSNLILLITNKVHELPAWFYRYAPFVRSIEIEMPGEKLRKNLFETHMPYYLDWEECPDNERDRNLLRFVNKTEGMSCLELDSVLTAAEGKPMNCIEDEIYNYRHGKKENPWLEIDGNRVKDMKEALEHTVLGQENAINSVIDIILRATTGLSGLQHSSGTRPRGVMLFAGPTGVGKTELAKSLARALFGAEEAMIRFDMSEYSQSHSDQRLLGAPPGYIGYDAGGELTNAIKSRPFSILLFDEIEKANPTILDKFLQILDDGRMTDSKGETVYFTECLIIFTSNIGMNGDSQITNKEVSHNELEEKVTNALRENWRPEFVNRIGRNVIVFDYIQEEGAEKILQKQLSEICKNVESQKNIFISWDKESLFYYKIRNYCIDNLQYGGRGIGNVVEHYFLAPLGREIGFGNIDTGAHIKLIDLKSNGVSENLVWEILI